MAQYLAAVDLDRPDDRAALDGLQRGAGGSIADPRQQTAQ